MNCLTRVGCLFLFMLPGVLSAQSTSGMEETVESITENQEEEELRDEASLQELADITEHPYNINSIDREELNRLPNLSMIQVNSFMHYRQRFGPFRELYELQSVPGWSVELIQRLLPYLTMHPVAETGETLGYAWKHARSEMLLRYARIIELGKSSAQDSVSGDDYAGSPDKILFRYRLQYKKTLQFGLAGEKDAGETFLIGASRLGFDFYSWHLCLKPEQSLIKTVAIGDFTVNMGQGLIEWQTYAPGRGFDIGGLEKRSDAIKPYRSIGEYAFHRGLAFEMGKKNWSFAGFYSNKKIDANMLNDSLVDAKPVFSSILMSGLHRTDAEMADRGSIRQTAYGMSLTRKHQIGKISLNAVHYQFSGSLQPGSDLYNLYRMRGSQHWHAGMDYSLSISRIHFFGELASTGAGSSAVLSGCMISLAPQADLSLVYRNIGARYQTIHGSAMTVRSSPSNEKGTYMMLTLRPAARWQADLQADFYRFPWLQYAVNAPVSGSEYGIRVTYRPTKKDEISLRIRVKDEWGNSSRYGTALSVVSRIYWYSVRLHASIYMSDRLTVRSRVELTSTQKEMEAQKQGVLFYIDMAYKPLMKKFSFNVRALLADTDDYSTRMYTYENDVAELTTVPAWYGRIQRAYINMARQMSSRIAVWVKLGMTRKNYNYLINNTLNQNQYIILTDIRLQCRVRL